MLSGEFSWKAASDITGTELPKVQSSNKYKKLSSIGSNLHSSIGYNFGQSSTVLFDFEIFSSSIDDGEMTQSLYEADSETVSEAQRISAEIEKDDISSNQYAIAYSSTMEVAPEIHYSWYIGQVDNEQNFNFTRGYQSVSTEGGTPVGPIDGYNSTYESEWSGPWIGFEMWEKVGAHTVLFRYQHYEVDFESSGDWNLESDLQHPVSFTQEADGEGGTMRIEYQYAFSNYLSIGGVYNWNRWIAEDGTYTLHNADGSSNTVLLDKVNWDYYTISVNLVFKI